MLNLSSLSQHEIFADNELEPFKISLDRLQKRMVKNKEADVNEIFRRIWNGGMPGLISGKYTNRDIFFSSYLQTYISRDLNVTFKNDSLFVDFICAVACRIGQELDVHSVACDVEISDDTAKRWLNILEKSEIIFYLHPYSNNLLKRVVKTPKVYFFDTGLVSYLIKYSSPEIKKSSNPTLSMVKNFDVLKKANIPLGMGAVICMKDQFSALNKDTLIIPVWSI